GSPPTCAQAPAQGGSRRRRRRRRRNRRLPQLTPGQVVGARSRPWRVRAPEEALVGQRVDNPATPGVMPGFGGMRHLIAALAATLVITATAQAAVPTATTGGVTGVTQTTARLHGTVKPNGQNTTWHFEIGPTTAYGAAT